MCPFVCYSFILITFSTKKEKKGLLRDFLRFYQWIYTHSECDPVAGVAGAGAGAGAGDDVGHHSGTL